MKRRARLLLALLTFASLATGGNTATAQFWPSAQHKLAKRLTSTVVEERRLAARQLHLLPPSVGRPLLLQALDDTDGEVRQRVGQLALTRGYGEVGAKVNGWLSDPEPTTRQLAARLLGLGPVGDEQVSSLARLLSDPVVDVRITAASVLARAEGEQAVAPLLNHLADANDGVRLAVIEALASQASPSANLPLLSMLQDPEAAVRRASLDALADIEGEPPPNALHIMLLDGDVQVRLSAVAAVAKKGVFNAVDALRERMNNDGDVHVRVAALGALAMLGDSPSCPSETRAVIGTTLVDALGHVKQELRDEALASLKRRPHLAVRELRLCLAQLSLAAPTAASRTFGCALALAQGARQTRVAGPRRAPTPVDNETQDDAYDLTLGAWRGGQLSDAELLVVLSTGKYVASLPTVLGLLTSSTAQTRQLALDTAFELVDPRAADGRPVEPLRAFIAAASSRDELVKAIVLLGHTGSQRAVPHLLPFASEQAPLTLRIAALRALSEIKQAQVPVAVLNSALTAESRHLRQTAAHALREGEWAGLAHPLVKLLQQATYDEVHDIATALWGVTPTITEPTLVDALAIAVERGEPAHRDVLLEAFARVPWTLAQAHWQRWAGALDCRSLAKIAEALGLHIEARPLLRSLLESKCEPVVLNALWALGRLPLDQTLIERLSVLAEGDAPRIAGNALFALASVRRSPNAATSEVTAAGTDTLRSLLCAGLERGKWGALALSNALVGLREHGHRCLRGGAAERELLAHPVRHVRKRAAQLLLSVPFTDESSPQLQSAAASLDRRALRLCARYDIDGEVAATCIGEPDMLISGDEHWATIVVVPTPDEEPLAVVPYVLERGFWLRSGTTDRRGAVLERVHVASDVKLLRL